MSELTLEALGYTPEEARVARRCHDLTTTPAQRTRALRLILDEHPLQRHSRLMVRDCPQPEPPEWRPLEYIQPRRREDQTA